MTVRSACSAANGDGCLTGPGGHRRRESVRRWSRWAVCAGLAAACAGAPATPEQRRLAEARLLQPFLRSTEVGCAELQIEVTGNFHGNVGQPAVDAGVHQVRREQGDGYRDTVWTNTVGDPVHAFVVTVGEPVEITETGLRQRPRTTFRVVNQVRLRVYEDRRPLQLSAAATGAFVLVREAGGTPHEVKEFVIADGVLRTP